SMPREPECDGPRVLRRSTAHVCGSNHWTDCIALPSSSRRQLDLRFSPSRHPLDSTSTVLFLGATATCRPSLDAPHRTQAPQIPWFPRHFSARWSRRPNAALLQSTGPQRLPSKRSTSTAPQSSSERSTCTVRYTSVG